MKNADAYFEQTKTGESRWWSWLVVLWFTIVIGLVIGTVVGGPIPGLVANLNPEAMAVYENAAVTHFAEMDTNRVLMLVAGCVLSVILGAICWLIHRFNSGGARKAFAWISGFFMIMSLVTAIQLYPLFNSPEVNAAFMPLLGESPIAYALMLLSFPAFLAGLYLGQKFIHKRSITSLHTAASKIDWKRILFAVAVTWAVLGTFSLVLNLTGVSPLRFTFDPARFFGFAIATLIFIPLQSGTEEILFRGYFNKGLAHFIPNIWIVFLITSVLFAAMHLSNPESVSGAEKGGLTHMLVMSQYFLFGFILCIIVYFEGGLEGVIGLHAGNNMFAAMFVNYEGSVLPTPSVYVSTPNPGVDAIVTIIVLTIIAAILFKTRKVNIASA